MSPIPSIRLQESTLVVGEWDIAITDKGGSGGRRRGLLPEEDERCIISFVSGRLKPANMLMRLMACGSNNPCFILVANLLQDRFTRLESLFVSTVVPSRCAAEDWNSRCIHCRRFRNREFNR
jgi:hypothetical protein